MNVFDKEGNHIDPKHGDFVKDDDGNPFRVNMKYTDYPGGSIESLGMKVYSPYDHVKFTLINDEMDIDKWMALVKKYKGTI